MVCMSDIFLFKHETIIVTKYKNPYLPHSSEKNFPQILLFFLSDNCEDTFSSSEFS